MSQHIKLDAEQAENFGQLRVVPTQGEGEERRSKPSLTLHLGPVRGESCAANLLQLLEETYEAHNPDGGRFGHIDTLAEEAKLAAELQPHVELHLWVLFPEQACCGLIEEGGGGDPSQHLLSH